MPWTSVRPATDGASVPESGDVMIVTTLPGSVPLIVLSVHRSKKIAEPMPCPPPHYWYFSVGISSNVPGGQIHFEDLPVYP